MHTLSGRQSGKTGLFSADKKCHRFIHHHGGPLRYTRHFPCRESRSVHFTHERKKHMKDGKIHVYYGEGKGKTTAATGLCLRAAGHGWQIGFVQFLKDGSSGEIAALSRISGVRVFPFLSPIKFVFAMSDAEKRKPAYFTIICGKKSSPPYQIWICWCWTKSSGQSKLEWWKRDN